MDIENGWRNLLSTPAYLVIVILWLQVVGVIQITTLSNRQYCVILDPVGADGKPQLGNKKLIKVKSEIL